MSEVGRKNIPLSRLHFGYGRARKRGISIVVCLIFNCLFAQSLTLEKLDSGSDASFRGLDVWKRGQIYRLKLNP